MSKTLKTSRAGLELIKEHEGYRATPYYCPGGVLTIGYGHTKTAKELNHVTPEEALELLRQDVKEAEQAVNDLVKVPLTQNKFNSLVSFVFNLGRGNFAKSTLLRKLNEGEYFAAANEFDRWVYADEKQMPGLIKRRAQEKQLFLTPDKEDTMTNNLESKPWYLSKGVWGGIIAALAGVLLAFDIDITGMENQLVEAVTALAGAALSIYGRVAADKKIK